MANPSVQKNFLGPQWPLGFIKVVNAGTPVNIMSLVDPSSVNAPATPDPPTAGREEPVVCNQIVFQGFKPGAAHGTQNNAGNVYVMVAGAGGDGSRDDDGSRIATIAPGQTFTLTPAATKGSAFNPYDFFIDADNANDGAYPLLVF